ncbi:putative monovalent cation/H+ antiporter subunit A [Halomonas eurihalina]|uniref:Putative monovalent cation/H+ antiporter subunit A n=1 Tax=Halomonas eurihalina TaxID=42566 RepID=A0A5D9D9M7_HALER|nr:putative monovalent cation/H+ antiporter subunit A [Halomonas eurihalina]MDR5860640.1 putative monovalent cation/H+ antiporter subunit A [Halomonas eurihalina]TZG40133.1 putative monovalent cation/H+ antiporter subunit A [Halomonas eurihalina]
MQLAILAGFVAAGLAPLLHRWFGAKTPLLMAVLPAAFAVWLATLWPSLADGKSLLLEWAWVPGLDITLTFLIDGLSWLFAMLITVIGALVLVYTGEYLKGERDLPRFLVVITAFMMSMLGLVLADNLVALFVFWELTSITSYLLIGFHHTDPVARKSAQQGLFVTVGGGLALLAGFVMLAQAGDSWSLAVLTERGEQLTGHALYTPLLICVLIGAFTKSAQFPFHFWLPNAMAAPTPVSAYLHSATMVKAGVYLLARLHPALGGTEPWEMTLSLVGAVTMLTGAFLAIRNTNIKKLLAYSTVMALGTLTMLLGIGTEGALIAFVTFLLAHSLYKGALFMVAGILDHETGTKDVTAMGGLWRVMPRTALVACVASLSLAGLPPLLGFIGKELMLTSVLATDHYGGLILLLAFTGAFLTLAVAAIVALKPFFGLRRDTPNTPHESPAGMLVGPALLAVLSLLFGLAPGMLDSLVETTVSGLGVVEPGVHLTLWHGINLPLLLSVASLVLGSLVFRYWDGIRGRLALLDPLIHRGPEHGYEMLMAGMVRFAEWQTRFLQNGYVRNYLVMTLLVLLGLVGHALLVRHPLEIGFSVDAYFHEVVVAGLMIAGALASCVMRSRLAAVAAVGIMGFSIALIFVLFSAPDLAITQLLVETLTVVLLVLVLFRLPRFATLSTPKERWRDLVVAGSFGTLMTLLMLSVLNGDQLSRISDYMVSNSQPLGHGHNIVNVILVDFRALDTLGEMFVLALASIGVHAMLRFHAAEHDASHGLSGRREDHG